MNLERPPGPLPPWPKRMWGMVQLWAWRLLFTALFLFRAKKSGRRPTHPLGVGGTGSVTVVRQPTFPANEHFRPGRTFTLRLRHANLGREDDCALDIRSASISMGEGYDRFDLPMNTGVVSAFWDTTSFVQFVRASLAGKPGLEALLAVSPRHRLGAACALVRAPDTYTGLTYYGQLTYRWLGLDGTARLVRYRLIPATGEGTHKIDDNDRSALWNFERRAGEKRASNYLREEFLGKARKGPIKYRFQAQFHDPAPPGDPAYDSAVSWQSEWHALADVMVDTPLEPAETETLQFSIANSPSSLGYFLPVGPDDGNALAYYRAFIYAKSQAVRLAAKR